MAPRKTKNTLRPKDGTTMRQFGGVLRPKDGTTMRRITKKALQQIMRGGPEKGPNAVLTSVLLNGQAFLCALGALLTNLNSRTSNLSE